MRAPHINGITNANTGSCDLTTDTKYADDNQACHLHWLFTGQDLCLSRSSLHPNTAGATEYTAQVTSQLAVMGYP